MNNDRRKIVKDSVQKLVEAREMLNTAIQTESTALSNIKTRGGSSERYEKVDEIVSSLKEAADNLDEALSSLKEFDY